MAVMSTRNNGTKRQWAQGSIENSKARRDSHPSPLPQWLPKPATNQSPHEERSLRETWSPLRVEGVSNRSVPEGLSGSVADQAGNDECRMSNGRVGAIAWREYQRPVVEDDVSGIVVLHWARQIGKSFTLAGWAVE